MTTDISPKLSSEHSWSDVLILLLCMIAVYSVIWSFTGITPLSSNVYNSYSLQADAWLQGRLDLPQDHKHLEIAIYHSKYYISFPPVPSVVLLPFAFFFGSNTPDNLITCLFSLLSGFIALKIANQLMLSKEEGIFVALFLTIGSNLLFFCFNGGVWFMAQTFSFTFSLLAIYFANSSNMKVHPSLSLFFWALSVGCRPFQIVYLPLLVLLLYRKCIRSGFTNGFIAFCLRFWSWLLPVIGVACLYFFYNFIRFGNPLEFGHSYLPEFQNADHGQFSVAYILDNLKNLFRLPIFEDHKLRFPTMNGMAFWLASPIYLSFMMLFFSLNRLKKNIAAPLLIILVILHFLLLCSHRTMGGWHFGNRYTVDALPFVYFIWLTAFRDRTWHRILDFSFLFLGLSLNLIGTIATYNHWI